MTRLGRAVGATSFIIVLPVMAQQTRQTPPQRRPPATDSAPVEPGKPALTHADYGKWESPGNATLSPDGKWFAYTISRVSGVSELRYRPVDRDSVRIARGAGNPTFTEDGRWLIYSVNPAAEADSTGSGVGAGGRGGRGGRGGQGRGGGAASAPAGAQNRNRAVIVDLQSGAAINVAGVQTFVLSSDGKYLALRRYAIAGRTGRGADLVVRALATGTDLVLSSIADYEWSPTGALLATTIDVDGQTGNAVQIVDAASGTVRALDGGVARYSGIAWRPRSSDLVTLRARTDAAFADTSYTILAWRNVATAPELHVYDFAADKSFPEGMRVVASRPVTWTEDGSTVLFGIAKRTPRGIRSGNTATAARAPANVQIWHSKDLRQWKQQELQAVQDRNRTHVAAWNVSANAFVRLADDSLETVQFSANQKSAIATSDKPYQREAMFGRPYRDVYRIDISTGKRDRILTRTFGAPRISPEGRYIAYANAGQWWVANLSSGALTNLTRTIRTTRFMNTEDDHPTAERSPYGLAGWTTGEKAVLLYDRFDIWMVNVDGTKPVRLTRGREDSTIFRRVVLDPAERTIDPARPLYLSAVGEFSRKSGYAYLTIGQPPTRLVWADMGVSGLEKATKADVFVYLKQSYGDSPDYFVGSGVLHDGVQVTATNPFQGEYAWGRQELLTYRTKTGERLQAMLTYPADYKPGVKYPMVVYFYEKLSQGFHSYIVPSERAQYNTQVFSQEGYFVLRPDISFRARDPGVSALECVTAAVRSVLTKGLVDPGKVGTMGHSWGGYQSAFFAVHGKGLFAAAIAGAPLTDLVSFYGYTSGNSGAGETGHFEVGQERMQVPLWTDPQAYIRNSTVFAVDKLDIPLLLEEGEADGNVNPFQSQELYNFARRLGKQVVYLVYPGENHNLAQRNNQIDYHYRQLEWFDHYLKGNPAAKWITDGETYLDRQKLLQPAASGGGRGGSQ
jgi:dipeptidyl aminopeptidase/acylaminoacyl peptidase